MCTQSKGGMKVVRTKEALDKDSQFLGIPLPIGTPSSKLHTLDPRPH